MPQTIVSASLPTPLAERLRSYAAAQDRTVSWVIRQLIRVDFERNGDAPKSAAVKRSASGEPKHGQG
jgi:predicted transcriptional regulator